jgi:hypothetical protein
MNRYLYPNDIKRITGLDVNLQSNPIISYNNYALDSNIYKLHYEDTLNSLEIVRWCKDNNHPLYVLKGYNNYTRMFPCLIRLYDIRKYFEYEDTTEKTLKENITKGLLKLESPNFKSFAVAYKFCTYEISVIQEYSYSIHSMKTCFEIKTNTKKRIVDFNQFLGNEDNTSLIFNEIIRMHNLNTAQYNAQYNAQYGRWSQEKIAMEEYKKETSNLSCLEQLRNEIKEWTKNALKF